MSAAKKLVVSGGNGFLGTRICKYAVERGWEVTSISRSGQPRWESVSASATPPAWSHKVSWESADIFKPANYAPLLKGADYVVQSMGILLEADYKGVLSGQESPIAGLQKAFNPNKGRTPNPLEKDKMGAGEEGEGKGDGASSYRPPESQQQLTYEIMNRDSAVLFAREAAKENVAAYAYISAAAGTVVLPKRYIQTKRETEQILAQDFPAMRSLYIRAPFMYDSSRTITMPLAAMVGAGTVFNTLTAGVFGGLLGSGGVKPLKADLVAEAVVEALSDESIRGPVEVPQLEELATKGWRKGML